MAETLLTGEEKVLTLHWGVEGREHGSIGFSVQALDSNSGEIFARAQYENLT